MEVRKMDVTQEHNANERPIKIEIEKFRERCSRKRSALWRSAARKQKWQHGLHFGSGLVTLLSGGAVTSLLATVSGAQTLKIVGAIITLLSGILSLIASAYFDTREMQKMFKVAAQFGALREKFDILLDTLPTMPPQTAQKKFNELRKDYSDLLPESDSLMPLRRGHRFVHDSGADPEK
jgi:hypothetical protein